VVVSTPLALASFSAAEEHPSPSPSPSPSPRPISDSIDRVVKRLEQERKDPCLQAKEKGQPCFPVEIVEPGISVRDSLRTPPTRDDSQAPSPNRPPSKAEMAPYRRGRVAPIVGIFSFDPGCALKVTVKNLKGKNDVYYLYRERDIHGERVALYDHRLDASTFQGELEFLGKFEGECNALAAYQKEQRKKLSQPTTGSP